MKRKRKTINESIFAGGGFGGGLDNTLAASSIGTLGSSNMVQGQGPGYVYAILPFTRSLEQKPIQFNEFNYYYPGCKVKWKSKSIKGNPERKGIINRIVKTEDGYIKYIIVKTCDTNELIKVSDNVDLIIEEPMNQTEYFRISPAFNMKLR